MKIIPFSSADFFHFADERIDVSALYESKHLSAGFGEIPVGVSQRRHIHRRKAQGDEIMLIFSGSFDVVSQGESQSYDVEKNGPIFVAVSDGEETWIRNTGATTVRFISVFSPPFSLAEIEWTEGQ